MFQDIASMLSSNWSIAVGMTVASGLAYYKFRRRPKNLPITPPTAADKFRRQQEAHLRHLGIHIGGKPWSLDQ